MIPSRRDATDARHSAALVRRRPTSLPALLLPACALLATCGGEAGEGGRGAPVSGPVETGAVVRDSAGIAVVENPAPRWRDGEGWTVAPEPEAVLEGGGERGFGLFRVAGLALLPDGAVAVANGGSGQVAVLEPDGRLRATFGRSGEGPGEFEWLNGVVTRGDTVVGIDGATLRLSLFAPDGALVRELAVEAEGGAPTGMRVAALGQVGVGVFREVGFASKMPEPGIVRLPGTAFVLGWGGERTPDLEGDFRGGAIFVGPQTMGTLPFGADLHIAGDEGGFMVGDGARAEVRAYGPDGRLERLLRWEYTPSGVDEELREAWRERELAGLRAEMARGAGGDFGGKAASEEARQELESYYRDQLERTPFPDSLPVFAGILVDDTGHTWVRRYPVTGLAAGPSAWQGKEGAAGGPAGGSDWWIFAPDGSWLGEVRTPPGLRVHAVADDAVWGVHTDELGVETVRRHTLER